MFFLVKTLHIDNQLVTLSILDSVKMEKMFLDHVLVLWSVNQRAAWREKIEVYLRNRLEKMPVLKFTDKLGKQDGGNWVFSNKAQFYSNG
jgi:hypothetical protein